MKKFLFNSILTLSVLVVISCKSDLPVTPDSQIPTFYDSSSYSNSIAIYSPTISNFTNLVKEIKKGRISGTTVPSATMTNLYTLGSISLKDMTTTYYQAVIQKSIIELEKASGGMYDPIKTVQENAQGGVYGSYLFDENGLEHEQVIEKGMFISTLFNETFSKLLSQNTISSVDNAIMLYGAHFRFPNSNNATKHQYADKFTAGYASRRDDNSGNGLYLSAKKDFIAIRHWIQNGNNTKRDESVQNLKKNWEKAIAATVINYCYDVMTKLSKTDPQVEDLSGGLHSLSEIIGFLHGMKSVQGTIISDSKLNEMLLLCNYPIDGTPSPYMFVTNPQSISKLSTLVLTLQTVYSFSNAEVELFKRNLVTEQSR